MSRLRVALDGRPLQSEPLGGVGRYLAGLIPRLAADVDVHLLLDARRPVAPTHVEGRIERVRLAAPGRLPGLAWLEVGVSPWLRHFGGIFHGTFNTLPLAWRGASVLTLHDLAPQLHPEDFRPATRAAWRFYVRASLSRARVITTVSRFIKDQIIQYFGIEPDRVLVAPDALDPVFSPARTADAPALAQRLGITTPYVVAVGGAPRRGLPVALDAWRRTIHALGESATLVVAGEKALPPQPGIVAPGYLDDLSWATLLAGAQALCYATRYEGFGLPALEAAASGTPVVCARVASLPEVLGEAGCWAEAPSAEALADVLVRVLTDTEFHCQQREAGLERARAAPSFDRVAQTVLDAYRCAS